MAAVVTAAVVAAAVVAAAVVAAASVVGMGWRGRCSGRGLGHCRNRAEQGSGRKKVFFHNEQGIDFEDE